MQKNRKIQVFVPENTLQQRSDPQSERVRFDLYRKEKEIREISRVLEQLSARDGDEHRRWLQENEELMISLAEEFVDDSLVKLDGAQMDSDTLELSVQIMTELRKTLGLFQTVIGSGEELEA